VACALVWRDAGLAIGFDPVNALAASLLSRLLLEPPTRIPPEVDAKIAREDDEQGVAQARIGALSGAGWLLIIPFLGWMGVRSWAAVSIFAIAMVLLQVISWRVVITRRPTPFTLRLVASVVGIVIAWSSLIFGPLILTPALAAMTVGMFMLEPDRGEHRWFLVGGLAVIAVPFALELLGIMEPSLRIGTDGILVNVRLAAFEPVPTMVLLLGSSLASVFVIGRTVATVTEKLRGTRRRLALHAWHLDHLLPRKP
jgi:hypothetical protein